MASAAPPFSGDAGAPSKPSARSQARGKRERPCDGCRRRKGRCVPVDGQSQCAACAVHNQPCTYVEDPKPRKRKTDSGRPVTPTSAKKKAHTYPPPGIAPAAGSQTIIQDSLHGTEPTVLQSPRQQTLLTSYTSTEHLTFIGPTTEYEPKLIRMSTTVADAGIDTIRDYGHALFFVNTPNTLNTQKMITTLQLLLKPRVAGMAVAYRRMVHENFPILDDSLIFQLLTGNMSNCDTLVVAAMFLAVFPWYERQEEKKPLARHDRTTLEGFAFGLYTQSLNQPTLNTVQAGLLLMQCPAVDTKALNSQLVEVGYELGLNLDCSNWEMAITDKALRKRLAWAIYMQDKWCALLHGRPSAISSSNWAVQQLRERDFTYGQQHQAPVLPETMESRTSRQSLFMQTVQLTVILADIIAAFYSVLASLDIEAKGVDGLRFIIEKVKKCQIRLKDWYDALPTSLLMSSSSTITTSSSSNTTTSATTPAPDSVMPVQGALGPNSLGMSGQAPLPPLPVSSSNTSLSQHGLASVSGSLPGLIPNTHRSSTSFLHLAYHATEITLQRALVRAQPGDPLIEPSLVALIRTGAKERLISALEFTNRLRSPALAGFWYFAAPAAFGLIGGFGALLAATSPAEEEATFYRLRLAEYRWTLAVAARHAPWLSRSRNLLDSQLILLDGVAAKPTASDLAELRVRKEAKDRAARRKRSSGAGGAGGAGGMASGGGGGREGASSSGAGRRSSFMLGGSESRFFIDEDALIDDDEEFDEMGEEELEEFERELEAEAEAEARAAAAAAAAARENEEMHDDDEG